jgi:hypothetical protein
VRERRLVGLRGGGVDEIGHRLGLRQVHLAIQEGALGELARLGHAGAVIEQALQHHLRREVAPVARDLDEVFPGGGIGRAEDGDDDLIDVRTVLVH